MRDAARTRRKILEAARRLLAEEGCAALGVNRIAHEAGVGKPLLYRYFGDLEGLIFELADEAQEDLSPANRGVDLEQAGALAVLRGLLTYGRGLAAGEAARALFARYMMEADVPGLAADILADGPTGAEPGEQPDRAAIHALLRAAIVFLVICRDRHPHWDGLAMETPKDMVRFENAIAWLVRAAWAESDGPAGAAAGRTG